MLIILNSKLIKLNLFLLLIPIYFMKKLIFVPIFVLLSLSCSDNNSVNNNNPNLPNYSFSIDIDTNLPSYESLQFAGNSVYLNQQGAGVRGVILFNTGSGFMAFDAACPNQPLSDCSTMTAAGINATCPCDNKKYSLYTGLSAGQQFPMKAYRTEVNASVVRVFN